MVAEAPDDAVGVWRVRVPRPPSFAEAVVATRQSLAGVTGEDAGSREAQALSGLLTAALDRHVRGLCECPRRHGQQDPICGYAQALATVLASG
jgi:hypothetical protein